jgi:acyl-coenzyme A thioesterase PaaI-like protein
VVVDARVVQRGSSLTIVEADGRGADGRLVVKALVTYKLSGARAR